MPEVITLGETMVSFVPAGEGLLRYEDDYKMKIAGAESNVASGLSKLGHSVGWISRLGNDEFGKYILRQIRADGVDCSRVVMDDRNSTGLMFKQLISGETQVFYYRENSAAAHIRPEDLDKAYFENAKIIHLSGITPVLSVSCRQTVEKAIEIAKQKNVLFSFDPNVRKKIWKGVDYTDLLKKLLFQADIVELGVEEAECILGTGCVEEIADIILKNKEETVIAIKDGKNGAYAVNAECMVKIPPYSCTCIETIGAGDAFNAGFLSGILEKKELEICGRMGAIAGALTTEVKGDTEGQPDREKLEQVLSQKKNLCR